MSAAIASTRRPSRMASAMYGSSSTSKTRMLEGYEPAHIAGVSKIAYVPATPRCLQSRRDPQQTGRSTDLTNPDSPAQRRRRGRRHRGARRGARLQVAGVVVLDGALA